MFITIHKSSGKQIVVYGIKHHADISKGNNFLPNNLTGLGTLYQVDLGSGYTWVNSIEFDKVYTCEGCGEYVSGFGDEDATGVLCSDCEDIGGDIIGDILLSLGRT